jgi:hypothetical protein
MCMEGRRCTGYAPIPTGLKPVSATKNPAKARLHAAVKTGPQCVLTQLFIPDGEFIHREFETRVCHKKPC